MDDIEKSIQAVSYSLPLSCKYLLSNNYPTSYFLDLDYYLIMTGTCSKCNSDGTIVQTINNMSEYDSQYLDLCDSCYLDYLTNNDINKV